MEQPKYLVRPHDFHIFEIDESNNCYRSYEKIEKVNRPNAYSHFTYEILTDGYGFFPIEENEIEIYEKKNDFYYKYMRWTCRSDGHGGSKGGSMEEYIKRFGEE